MAERTLAAKREFILYDDALMRHAQPELFSARSWARHEALGGSMGGRGSTWIVRGEAGDWVLRHYRRGGLVARFVSDYYLWTGLERSRAWREWRLLDALYKEGLPVPRPVAARVQRQGLGYRADLMTCLIPDARTLASALRNARLDALPWQGIGACIRRFHAAGVYHADLNAHNILLAGNDKIYLLDFDRGERRTPGVLWQEANLGRLLRSLRKLIAPSVIEGNAWNKLLDGYKITN